MALKDAVLALTEHVTRYGTDADTELVAKVNDALGIKTADADDSSDDDSKDDSTDAS